MASAIISKENITCPVCVDVFNNPRILPCGHSLCYTCINQLIVSTINNHYDDTLFQCPSCRADVEIPPAIPGRERAEHFARNHILHSLVSEYVETYNTDEVNVCQDNPSVCASHNEDIKLFCEDHCIALCSICVCLEHRQCEKIITLEDAMDRIMPLLTENIDKIKIVQNRTRVLKENFDSLAAMLHSSVALCHHEIDTISEKIIEKTLARKEELHAIVNDKQKHQEKEIEKQNLSVHKLLDDIAHAKSLYEKSPSEISALMFLIKDQNIDEQIEKWEESITNIYNSGKSSKVHFTPNRRTAEFLKCTADLGDVSETDAAKASIPLRNDPPSAYSSFEDITLPSLPENTEEPQRQSMMSESGLTLTNQHLYGTDSFPVVSFCDESHIVVCFESSTKLLFVAVDESQEFAVENEVILQFLPWDITVYKQCVALTHSDAKAISIFKLPALTMKRIFTTSRKCSGIDRLQGKFLISCFYDGCLQLLSSKGKLLVETGKIFESPDCVSVSEKDNCVFVSDTASRSVFCLNSNLSLKWVFKQELLTYPRGVCALHSGTVIVSCLWTNKIVEVDIYGRYKRTILDEKDGLVKPRTLYLNRDKSLMIVCERGGSIKLFSLTDIKD